MPFETNFALRLISLNANTWTDVSGYSYVPIDANTIVISNIGTVDIYLRSDPANANSQVTISAGLSYEISGHRPNLEPPCRFQAMSQVCSLLASSGTPTALVECIR